jgi:hypothetical protein
MYRHRTVSAWHREEDGSYRAEIEGYELRVKWRPESKEARRGFQWTAKGPDDAKLEAPDVVEEIEQAMGDAEYALAVALHPELI